MTQNVSPSDNATAEKVNKNGYVGLFSRVRAFAAFLFGLFRKSLLGRFLTSYSKTENALIGDGLIRNLPRFVKKTRLKTAGWIENNAILNAIRSAGSFLMRAPISMYGIFFLFYGLVSGGIAFISGMPDSAFNVGRLILSVIITVASIPLVCITGSVMETIPCSRLARYFTDGFMAFPEKKNVRRMERKNIVVLMYIGIFLGIIFGALTFYYDVIMIPLIFAGLIILSAVLIYPETGVVILIGFLPFIMLFDPNGLLLSVLVATIWFSYIFKLVLGRRVIKAGLLDWAVILFAANVLLSGIASPGGTGSLIDAIRLAALMSVYFPIVNLIKSTEWARRCSKLLVFNSSVIAYCYILIFFFGDNVSEWCGNVGARVIGNVIGTMISAFESDTLMPCFFIMMTPLAVMSLRGSKRLAPTLIKALTAAVFVVSIFLTMDGWAWIAALIGIIIMPVLYTPGSLSATLISLFPVTCAGLWLPKINQKYLHLEDFAPIEAASDAIVDAFSHINVQINKNVISMIKDNPFGIGIGRSAFEAAYPMYAEAGTEIASYVSSFYLGVTAHTGVCGLILIILAVILFLQKCFEFFKRADNRAAGAKVLALFAGIIGILIYGIDNWIWADPSMFLLFWAVIALASAYINCGYEDNQRNCAEHGVTSLSSDITIFK